MEFYIPMHGLDFAPPTPILSAGGHGIKVTSPCPSSHPLSRSVCVIECPGFSTSSGVVVAIRTDPITVASCSIRALVLTAGHCIGQKFGNSSEIHVLFDPATPLAYVNAVLIKDFSDWFAFPLRDEVTGFQYALPDDLAIVGIADFPGSVQESEISQSIRPGDSVYVVGFPKRTNNSAYCAPCLAGDLNIESTISSAFCGFNRRIISDGVVLNSNTTECICVDYSATSGLSGAPVYSEYGHLVGINVGGAGVKFQLQVGQIIGLISQGKCADARTFFYGLKRDILSDNTFDKDNRYLQGSLDFLKVAVKHKDLLTVAEHAADLMRSLTLAYRNPHYLNHNIAVSTTHPVFQKIFNSIRKFKCATQTSFSSMVDFIDYLSL
jgi:hypothetical protein